MLCFAVIQFVPGGPVEQAIMRMRGIGSGGESSGGTGVQGTVSDEQRGIGIEPGDPGEAVVEKGALGLVEAGGLGDENLLETGLDARAVEPGVLGLGDAVGGHVAVSDGEPFQKACQCLVVGQGEESARSDDDERRSARDRR